MSDTHIHIHIHVHHAKTEGGDEYPQIQVTKGKNYDAVSPDSDEDDPHYKPRGPRGRSEKPATWR